MYSLDLLRQNIEKHIALSETEYKIFRQFFKLETIAKKDFFLKQGDICKQEAFVIDGCFRIFTLDKAGNEHVLYFAIQNWWLSDIDSFINQSPSYLSIQALETSEILTIGKANKEKAYTQIPKIEKLFRIMSQKFLAATQRRIIQNHSLTADQRYLHFLDNYPQISEKLTNIQIASYLGISHEFLSKIRRKITNRK